MLRARQYGADLILIGRGLRLACCSGSSVIRNRLRCIHYRARAQRVCYCGPELSTRAEVSQCADDEAEYRYCLAIIWALIEHRLVAVGLP